jgi:hypothetical protein
MFATLLAVTWSLAACAQPAAPASTVLTSSTGTGTVGLPAEIVTAGTLKVAFDTANAAAAARDQVTGDFGAVNIALLES